MDEPWLVVITGPVGAGKSTVALALADRLRRSGETAAVIDLDMVYCMARQGGGYGEANTWTMARRGAAALADAFYRDGIQAVIVEGEFFTPEELDALHGSLTIPVTVQFVTLQVSYEQALVRVAGDPTRGMSRDPLFLRRLHGQFLGALPTLRAASSPIDADHRTPDELAAEIHEALLKLSSGTT